MAGGKEIRNKIKSVENTRKITKAMEAKKAAEEALQNKTAKLDLAQAEAELAEAVAQLATIEKLRKRRH